MNFNFNDITNILNEEYNYNVAWDYKRTKTNPEIKKEIENFVATKLPYLLKGLNAFKKIKIYTAEIPNKRVGLFINGTASEPVILLDQEMLIDACKKYNVNIGVAIQTTLTHELYHAYQEYNGYDETADDSEDKAEEFAVSFYKTGRIDKKFILKKDTK